MVIECVPNVSEGRRTAVVDALASSIRDQEDVHLLDYSADASHHRSVFTFVGSASSVERAVLSLFAVAIAAIDLRLHRGGHPRIGAVDVVPFVPLEGATMNDCIALARAVGSAIAERFAIPVYLYEAAATAPARRRLEQIRRGGMEALADRMRAPGWAPDFGPPVPHPSAGATAVGARSLLIAYNINLATDRLDVARTIARAIRESSGGLPHVKAMAVPLTARGIVQVSANLTDYTRTSMKTVYEAVREHADRFGVAVLESEIVGLVPADAITPSTATMLRITGFSPDKILENRLRNATRV